MIQTTNENFSEGDKDPGTKKKGRSEVKILVFWNDPENPEVFCLTQEALNSLGENN